MRGAPEVVSGGAAASDVVPDPGLVHAARRSCSAASNATGEIIPIAECLRTVLYSSIHAAILARAWALVAKRSSERSSNSSVECHASIAALSSADPGRPIDWEIRSRSQAARTVPEVYSLPWSVLNRIRFNTDYAEVDVKPENLRMACSGRAC